MMIKHVIGKATFALAFASIPAFAQQAVQQPVERHPVDLPGPMETLTEMQDAGRFAFMAADENGDGQISQKEAVDAANLSVGGFFFRADANGDGTLSQEEAKQARESFLSGKPWLRYFVTSARNAKAQADGSATQSPMQAIAGILDTNNDKQLQATELRQVVQTTVEAGFTTADTNRDGQLNPAELNAAATSASRAVAQAEFQQADADKNGQISEAEFEKAIVEPSKIVFKVIDLNHDGQISEQEAQTLRQLLASKIQLLNFPEPANSPRNTVNRVLGTSTQPAATAQPAAPTTPAAPR